MPPPGASHAEQLEPPVPQTPHQLAEMVERFLDAHREGAVLEDGKAIFELARSQVRVRAEGDRCTLQMWNAERHLVRTVTAAAERRGALRLSTQRFGQARDKSLVLAPASERREPNRREPGRQSYLRLLERVLVREFSDWQPEAFRTAMDLERSFGPAYARGSLVRGGEAWAVIGVGAAESQAIVDGVLTLGVLWLHHCRERGDGRRRYRGLRVIVPKGMAVLTLARLHWMNTAAAEWQLFELDERSEELEGRDAADQGNLRTRLVHHPDQAGAKERFGPSIEAVMSLVPPGEAHRVEQRLRSTSELAFLLHGLEFARARISLAPGSFAHALAITVGVGTSETALSAETRAELEAHVAELFARRDARAARVGRRLQPHPPGRGIGGYTGRPAHNRFLMHDSGELPPAEKSDGLEWRERALAAQQDPLFRAVPERWLESVLRENLAPLTRALAPEPGQASQSAYGYANEADPDTRGNRAEASVVDLGEWRLRRSGRGSECLIPRFDPRFVYTQVPAIAGAGDRGMLDLLGVTGDGRLAVIEVKASDDLQLAMQGLDYWIRVRHHHINTGDGANGDTSGGNDLQRHGYFCGAELSALAPRLYLVAPALHVHPATETILRYFSPRVEWTLLALDERWRQEVRVVWKKCGGQTARSFASTPASKLAGDPGALRMTALKREDCTHTEAARVRVAGCG